jgi:hypothetical protein
MRWSDSCTSKHRLAMAQHNTYISLIARLDKAATAYTAPPLYVRYFQGVHG